MFFRFLRGALLVWVFFILVSSFTGGGPFRSLEDQAGGLALKIVDAVADKADKLKSEAGLIIDEIRDLMGGHKGLAQNTEENRGG